jgi:hypothetical protein
MAQFRRARTCGSGTRGNQSRERAASRRRIELGQTEALVDVVVQVLQLWLPSMGWRAGSKGRLAVRG